MSQIATPDRRALPLLLALVAFKLLFHLAVNVPPLHTSGVTPPLHTSGVTPPLHAGATPPSHASAMTWAGYELFRDELYYLACADHLAWGYVDQPPLSIFLLAAVRAVAGDSLFALRLVPALAGAAVVLFTGLLARELGGGRFAVALAALGSIVAGTVLSFSSIWSMNAFDLALVAVAGFLLARLLRTGDARYWIPLGITLGLGLLNKIGVLWIGLGIAVGLVATRERRWLATPWPWVAGALAALIFAPYVMWNVAHDWAHLEFIERAVAGKYSGLSAGIFLSSQLLIQNPTNLLLWLGGLGWLLFAPGGRRFRLLGIVWMTACAVLTANGHSKPDYLASAYAILFAAGGVAWEKILPPRAYVRGAALAVVASGIAFAPFAVPMLPVDAYVRYSRLLGVAPSTPEGHELADLPQFYADMFGWEAKAAAVAEVYHALPAADRERAAIFAHNYGRSGAIDYFADEYGLPGAIGSHNNYWHWGPGETGGEVWIVLGGERDDLERRFESVEVAGVATCDHCIPYERDLPIHVCRRLRLAVEELWPLTRHYD